MLRALKFAWECMKDFETVASIVPSSSAVTQNVVSKVRGDARRVVVEYGSGTGAISKGLLEPGVLTPDSTVILIEVVEGLANELTAQFADDPRVKIFHDTAQNVRGILEECGIDYADHVISGIPFSRLPPEDALTIMQQTHDVLKPGGTLIAYQFRRRVRGLMSRFFDRITHERIWWNFPPLHVYVAKKNVGRNPMIDNT